MRRIPPPVRYVRLAAGFLVLAVAGLVVGTVADAHQLSSFGYLGFIAGLGLMIGFLGRAHFIGVTVPSMGQQVTAMVQAIEAGQPVYGSFWAGLRYPGREEGSWPASDDQFALPPPPLARWLSGQVVITPESVMWRRTVGRARDLTGAECTGERRPDPSYTEMSLTLPQVYEGEPLKVITLYVNGTDVELVTQVQLVEILRYSLARTPSIHGSGTGRVGGSGETS